MFTKETDLINQLVQDYEDVRIKQELYLGDWLDGDYKKLVPRIFLQLRAMRRLVYYLQDALERDRLPDKIRLLGSERLEEMFETHPEIWDEYRPYFSDISYTVIKHLIIEEMWKFSVDRDSLRDGIWEESDYWNFKSIESIMNTICLICDELTIDPYTYYEETKVVTNDDEVECEWMNDVSLYDDITPDLDTPLCITPVEIDSIREENYI